MLGTLDKFKVIKKLGSGSSCEVMLAVDTETGEEVALKILKQGMNPMEQETVQAEISTLCKMEGQANIIGLRDFGTGTYELLTGEKLAVDYIVLELAKGGELFDVILSSGRFDETMARHYFKQLLSGLDHCHRNGFAHRDIKPENLILDHLSVLKIADFGFAARLPEGEGQLDMKLGSPGYMAPELHLSLPYSGQSVDLFAAGVTLFIMATGAPPFTTATKTDPFYRLLAGNRADLFWKAHCRQFPRGAAFFSNEFKDLLTSMLQMQPAARPTMQDILAHPWMQGEEPGLFRLCEETYLRKELLDQMKLRESEMNEEMTCDSSQF